MDSNRSIDSNKSAIKIKMIVIHTKEFLDIYHHLILWQYTKWKTRIIVYFIKCDETEGHYIVRLMQSTISDFKIEMLRSQEHIMLLFYKQVTIKNKRRE